MSGEGDRTLKSSISRSHCSERVRAIDLANFSNRFVGLGLRRLIFSSEANLMPDTPSSRRHAHHIAATAFLPTLLFPIPKNHSIAYKQVSPAAAPSDRNICSSICKVLTSRLLSSRLGKAKACGPSGLFSSISRSVEFRSTGSGTSENRKTDNRLQPHFSMSLLGPKSFPIPLTVAEGEREAIVESSSKIVKSQTALMRPLRCCTLLSS